MMFGMYTTNPVVDPLLSQFHSSINFGRSKVRGMILKSDPIITIYCKTNDFHVAVVYVPQCEYFHTT